MKLYETCNEIDALWDAIEAVEEEGGDVAPALVEQMERLQLDYDRQLDWCWKTIKNCEAWEVAAKAEAAALAAKAKRFASRAAAVKALVDYALDGAAWKSADELRQFCYHKNPPSVEYTNRAAVPDEWCEFERVEKSREILAALKAGQEIPGAVLVTNRKHLRLK